MKKGLPTTGNSRRLSLKGEALGIGNGRSKKKPSKNAAQEALAKCKNIIRNNKIPCFPRGFQYICA